MPDEALGVVLKATASGGPAAVPMPPMPPMPPPPPLPRRQRRSRPAPRGPLCLPCDAPPAAFDGSLQVHRMIHDFKTAPCALESSGQMHDHRCCPFFHGHRDRRRQVFTEAGHHRYKAEPCGERFDSQRQCPQGEDCTRCHSTAELLYHPDLFRKRLCHQAKRCPRGRFCAYAHSRQELLVPHFGEPEEVQPTEDFMAHEFKTQWCPIGGPHDWESCVYAHTYRDWRRVPAVGYSSRPCPQWTRSVSTGSPELTYAQRCPRGMACPWAHGAKEQLYHPQFYKTSPCNEGSCRRGALCAFTHGECDVRQPGHAREPRDFKHPLPDAMKILRQHQPCYWNPPRYHALEEHGRGYGMDQALGDLPMDQAHPQPESCRPFPVHGADPGANPAATVGVDFGSYGVPHFPHYYQLVPLASPHIVQHAPSGFLQLPEPYEACYGLAPGHENMVWYHDGSPAAQLQDDPKMGSLSATLHGYLQSCGYQTDALSPCKSSPSKSRRSRDGLRTPSSLGSPPLSEAHTELPSPRSDQAHSGGPPEVSGPSSTDDPGETDRSGVDALGDLHDSDAAGSTAC